MTRIPNKMNPNPSKCVLVTVSRKNNTPITMVKINASAPKGYARLNGVKESIQTHKTDMII